MTLDRISEEYAIPDKIKNMNADDWTDIMLALGPRQARSNAELYFRAKSTMLYLEEYEELLKTSPFNINEIRIEYFANDIFCFTNTVHFKTHYLFALQ